MPIINRNEIIEYAEAHGLRRVLIVTALPLEMRAVRAHLSTLGAAQGRYGTIYECGQFVAEGCDWLVVVAESGAGTHPAHALVSAAQLDFDDFELIILVGIAASRKAEAQIGSVVAANYLYLPSTGKFDPTLGHTGRPRTLNIDRRLVGLAQKVERDAEWTARIRDPLRCTLPHQGDEIYPKPFPPLAFVAPIASIEAVSADPNSEPETHIASNYGDTLAIEMEGYGAVYAADLERTPLIVIRGISDMRIGKTPGSDVVLQPIAAAHASAFAFELLNLWGQVERKHATPRSPSRDMRPIAAEAPISSDGEVSYRPVDSDATNYRGILVLSFAGNAAEFPPERVAQILETLQSVTNNPRLSIVRTEEGSFRILLRVSEYDRRKLEEPETSLRLMRDHAARLTGILSDDEYRIAASQEVALARASRDLLEWPQTLPDGTHLARPELDQILSAIETSESSTTAVLGPPGSGKSALLASIGKELLARGVPVLAIKADLLDPGIRSEEELQAFLELARLPSLALSEVSRLKPVVLIVDQLDALAGYVDLRTGRLSVLLNLVRKLGARKNIHVLLSSRLFEYEHDARLKAVRADSVSLTLPAWSEVLPVLERFGIRAEGWPADAQELMRTPQALSTFLKLKDLTREPFRNYQTMLDQLWREQILEKPNGSRLANLASEIAQIMADKETLWLAEARFDLQANDLRALLASGILTDFGGTGGRVGFSHQTVFEHALARAFSQGEGRLSSFILGRQSSLFVRPKLWAALTYLRDVEQATYESEIKTLWYTTDLRLHLRHMLVEFLGQQASPNALEVTLFDRALSSEERRVALQAMAGSAGWLKLFGSTHLSRAMLNSRESGAALHVLSSAWSSDPDSVIALAKRHWVPEASFDFETWRLLQNSPIWTDEVVEIAEALVERSNIDPHSFEYLILTIGVDHPIVALRLVSARLRTQLREALKVSKAREREPPSDATLPEMMEWQLLHSCEKPISDVIEQRSGWEGLEALARDHSESFLHFIWPWFADALAGLRHMREKIDQQRPGFPLPWELDFRFREEDDSGLDEPPLLGALAVALDAFAANDTSAFLAWLSNHEAENATPAQRLFASALASQPEIYAERAAEFLLSDKNRFHLGSIHDSTSTTKRLIKLTSPFWSSKTLDTFTTAVRSYKPSVPSGIGGKSKQHFNDSMRYLKFEILRCLPEERLSLPVRSYLNEERRRFPEERKTGRIQGGWIGSPISAQELLQASDDDVLNAFRKVPDISEWDHPKQWMKGGNIQLSREFAESAKSQPERAARIIQKFQPSFGGRAAGYAIDAMAENADPGLIFSLIVSLDQKGFAAGEFRRSVANALQRLLNRNVAIPDQIVTMLKDWLSQRAAVAETDNEKPEVEGQLTEGAEQDRTEKHEGSVLWAHGAISFLPHGNYPVLETISRILLGRKDSDGLLEVFREHLRSAEDPDVWRALLGYVRYIYPTDIADLSQFLARLFEKYPSIATTHDALVMLAHLHWRLPELVRGTVTPWKDSGIRLQQAYGELITLIALVQPELGWPGQLLSEIEANCELGSAKLGAAHAAVNIWPDAKDKEPIARLLVALVPDADQAMWSAIFDLFRLVDEITPEPEWVSLLEVLAENIHKFRGGDSTFVVDRLQTLLPHHAVLVASLARGLIKGWRDELGDIRSATASAASELVDLAITLHRLGPDTRELGTDLFEDLLTINAYTARETLDEIDNRFRATPRAARRRLPRRTRRPRVRTARHA